MGALWFTNLEVLCAPSFGGLVAVSLRGHQWFDPWPLAMGLWCSVWGDTLAPGPTLRLPKGFLKDSHLIGIMRCAIVTLSTQEIPRLPGARCQGQK